MDDDREFLDWFHTTWHDAETALHDGDAGPRFETWSEQEPVSLFGAWKNATNAEDARDVFRQIADSFSDVEEGRIELVAHGVSADLAYTAHREHTTTTVNGQPSSYVLRVTQVYRREQGAWKVIHRHGDNEANIQSP